MMAIVKMLFTSKLGLIGLALAGALLGGAYLYHTSTVATLELAQERAETRASLAETDLVLTEANNKFLLDESLAAEASAKRLQSELADIRARHRPIRQRIDTAPASDDGPLAPVLRDTLRALRAGKP